MNLSLVVVSLHQLQVSLCQATVWFEPRMNLTLSSCSAVEQAPVQVVLFM